MKGFCLGLLPQPPQKVNLFNYGGIIYTPQYQRLATHLLSIVGMVCHTRPLRNSLCAKQSI